MPDENVGYFIARWQASLYSSEWRNLPVHNGNCKHPVPVVSQNAKTSYLRDNPLYIHRVTQKSAYTVEINTFKQKMSSNFFSFHIAFKNAFDKEERIHIILMAGPGSCRRTMHGDFWDKLRNLPSMKQLRLIFSAWFHCRCCNIQRESFLTLQEDFVVPLEHDKLQVFAFISSKERQETGWHETDCLYRFKRTVRDYRNELVSWAFRNIKRNYKQIRRHLWLVIHFNA